MSYAGIFSVSGLLLYCMIGHVELHDVHRKAAECHDSSISFHTKFQ